MLRRLRRYTRLSRYPRLREAAHALRWRWLDFADRALASERSDRRRARELSGFRYKRSAQAIDRIYIDVSVIHHNDAGTGIQRVVRSLRRYLPGAICPDIKVETLILRKAHGEYVTADGAHMIGAPGALFFGLDFATDSVFAARHDLGQFKDAGGQLWFLLHDMLPLTHPRWFTAASRLKYRRWLRVCAALADGILCVSPVVAAQLEQYLSDRYGPENLPRIATINLGSDITEADRGLAASELPAAKGLDESIFKRAALVVGTLEPRKGHGDLLAAFEQLWAAGHDIPLIFIGRPGWGTKKLQAAIRHHKEQGRRLFWLDDVNDHQLHAAYHHCRLAIVPSLAEGYGLPLDEALALGAPVLARDIPVFRRHDDAPVSYFQEHADAASIASAVLDAYKTSSRAVSPPPIRRWDDTARQVATALACAAELIPATRRS